LGIVSCRLGLNKEALAYAQRLETMPAPSYWAPAVHALAADIRAQVDIADGNLKAALQRIESIPLISVPVDISAMLTNRVPELVWHAELLNQLGREDEALNYYDNLMEGVVSFLPAKALTLLRRAEIHDRKGDKAEAAQLYVQFLKFWQMPDPEFQPIVQQVRTRLTAMQRKTD
jgi:tetratricopeptide (TPR) repeat protein